MWLVKCDILTVVTMQTAVLRYHTLRVVTMQTAVLRYHTLTVVTMQTAVLRYHNLRYNISSIQRNQLSLHSCTVTLQ